MALCSPPSSPCRLYVAISQNKFTLFIIVHFPTAAICQDLEIQSNGSLQSTISEITNLLNRNHLNNICANFHAYWTNLQGVSKISGTTHSVDQDCTLMLCYFLLVPLICYLVVSCVLCTFVMPMLLAFCSSLIISIHNDEIEWQISHHYQH